MSSALEDSAIAGYYAGKSVLVTGASGFLGKVLVEKLLRSCPKIGKIFVHIRDKKGKSSVERVADLINGKIFDRIRESDPKILHKVEPVSGDLAAPRLGISPHDEEILVSEVAIVFHVAATVKFDEPLRTAVEINLGGTASVLRLCKEMKKLEALVHVSTAFSNCERTIVEEEVYPAPVDAARLLDSLQWLDVAALDALCPCIKGNKVNTYTLTKALAESYLESYGGGVPIAIVRPSIVGNCYEEPYTGWVDVVHGAGGAILAIAAGAWRNSWSHEDDIAYGIPADQCVNLIIAAGWEVGSGSRETISEAITGDADRTSALKIYNFDSGLINPAKWSTCIRSDVNAGRRKYCLENAIWYPSHQQHSTWLSFKVNSLIKEALPACLTDLATRIAGGKPIAKKIYDRIQNTTYGLRFFMVGRWEFRSENVPRLLEKLSRTDREIFNFDVRKNDWALYAENCVLGFRTYYLKQDPKTIPRSMKRMRRLRLVRILVKAVIAVFWLLIITKIAGIDLFQPLAGLSRN